MSYHHLTLKERKIIAQMKQDHQSIRAIAEELERSPSTISREIKRNGRSTQRHDRYFPYKAQQQYRERIQRQRTGKYAHRQLVDHVCERIMEDWSPDQISKTARMDFADNPGMQVARSTIYRWLDKGQIPQARELCGHLRHHGHKHGERRGKLHGVRELSERPEVIRRRVRTGDWEADTIVGTANRSGPCLLSLCDRKTRYCHLFLLRENTKKEVLRALTSIFGGQDMPLHSITADRGKEFYCYKDAEQAFHIPWFFTRPSSPWQKGSVENLNGLVRQYFPKKTDFRSVTPQQVQQAMDRLNHRPRNCLGYLSPAQVLHLG